VLLENCSLGNNPEKQVKPFRDCADEGTRNVWVFGAACPFHIS